MKIKQNHKTSRSWGDIWKDLALGIERRFYCWLEREPIASDLEAEKPWGILGRQRGGHIGLGRVLAKRCPQPFLSHKPRKILPPAGRRGLLVEESAHTFCCSEGKTTACLIHVKWGPPCTGQTWCPGLCKVHPVLLYFGVLSKGCLKLASR